MYHPQIPGIILERVLFSDYKLVSTDGVKQVFKRGSALGTIAFWATGGEWDKSPTKLTIKYLPLPEKIKVSFQWELNYPFELNDAEQQGYKTWIDNQLKNFVEYVQKWLESDHRLRGEIDAS
jgi:hypothetical protein